MKKNCKYNQAPQNAHVATIVASAKKAMKNPLKRILGQCSKGMLAVFMEVE